MLRRFFVHPEGFEPSTPRAEIWYSIQLNYGCLFQFAISRVQLTIIECFITGICQLYSANCQESTSLTLVAASFNRMADATLRPDSSIILAPSSAFVP